MVVVNYFHGTSKYLTQYFYGIFTVISPHENTLKLFDAALAVPSQIVIILIRFVRDSVMTTGLYSILKKNLQFKYY